MSKILVFEVEQPIGTFYLGKIQIKELKTIAYVERRNSNGKGVQRQLKENKVSDITYYCKDPDAVFPTPIILSVDGAAEITAKFPNSGIYEITLGEHSAEIIDGQHRFEGIKNSGLDDISLPVAIMFNLDNSAKAYIFSTINNNQTKVDKSLIYELFDVAKERSPYKTCHEIAKVLNTKEDSAYCGKIKMLEKRTSPEETLSQGTFVTHLLRLITTEANKDTIDSKNAVEIKDNRNLVFRKYFIADRDDVIVKILLNYFNAAQKVFLKEWNDERYILTKTTGYSGMIKALKILVPYGENVGDLSQDFFVGIFAKLKAYLQLQNMGLTSDCFPSGAVGEKTLCDAITAQIQNIY